MIDELLRQLSRARVAENAFNQYAASGALSRANAIRRENLRRYLVEMSARRPDAILIGEAPSYRGGRLTGIPFVSETLLECGVDSIGMLGAGRGYRLAGEWEKRSTEASATMVWATIREIDPLPLLWNAFPFHPFRAGNPRSNRPPTARELAIGEPFIRAMLDLYAPRHVVAVGNKAAESLTRLGIAHARVRHPSQGGKRAFVEGVRALLCMR